ncbi:hypothetical protein MH117_18100 [Paenibacillus sp. ACRRX]|uniref:prenylated flavin chaperone LpdD n=1 Tax=unclassified Paenibacillus TaxID=185978 RepID=UPI001EF44F22|nr:MULTISPECIES: hypothetical protein [unclassified Paenibacillus]MCG7409333.1 hypothetical protein [Paenibacillus sp. ACRRX]MDK8179991.1 hypothetical protein [Paenibacillus sp. UMB4589-SE434]
MKWNIPSNSIQCRIERIGRDWLVTLTGGEMPEDHHIGAVSIAYRAPEMQSGWKVDTLKVPRHKEHVLTNPMALEAAATLGGTVTVAAGVHFDQLTAEQIQIVVDECWRLLREALNHTD